MHRKEAETPSDSGSPGTVRKARAGYLRVCAARWSWCLISLGLGLLLTSGVLLWRLHAYGMVVRLASVDRLSDIVPSPPAPSESAVAAGEFREKDPILLLRQVMNLVERAGPDPAGGALQFLAHAKAGGGLTCFGMAHLYAAAARANGLEARIIGLSRNLGDRYDAHTTVEIRQGQRWVIFDPTFNASFEKNGARLGAEEVQQALLDGTFQAVAPVFYGPVKYPARLETYYMHWLSLFNNVFVLDASQGRFAKLPPWRYWLGPRIYVKTLPGHPNEHIRFWDGLYLLSTAILPSLGLALLAVGGMGLWSCRKAARVESQHELGPGKDIVSSG
jgi:hypothetical protein